MEGNVPAASMTEAAPLTEMAEVYGASDETTSKWRAACDAVIAAEAALDAAKRERDHAKEAAQDEAAAAAQEDFARLAGLPEVGLRIKAAHYGDYPLRRGYTYEVTSVYLRAQATVGYRRHYSSTEPLLGWVGAFEFEPRVEMVNIKKDGSRGSHVERLHPSNSVFAKAAKAAGRHS